MDLAYQGWMAEPGNYLDGRGEDKPQVEVGETLAHKVGQSTMQNKPVAGHCDGIETKWAKLV